MANAKQPKIKYDPEAKILSIRLSQEKSVDSDAKGNVVLDYGKGGELVNIDIMKVSLSEFGRIQTVRGLVGLPGSA